MADLEVSRRSASHQKAQTTSRPSTPLRPSSRTSLRDSQAFTPGSRLDSSTAATSALYTLEALEPAFAELSDSMADLEANFMHLQLMHESLARFNEGFASFLYGMNMNAFCVDFPEAPVHESFARVKTRQFNDENVAQSSHFRSEAGNEETFLTTDTSFVEHPPSAKASTRFVAPRTSYVDKSDPPKHNTYRRGTSAALPTTNNTTTRAPVGASKSTRPGRGSGIARGRSTAVNRGSR